MITRIYLFITFHSVWSTQYSKTSMIPHSYGICSSYCEESIFFLFFAP